MSISLCHCCGSNKFKAQSVLWQKLIDDWQLAKHEIDYIDRQQGFYCLECGSNIRSIALAISLMKIFGFEGGLFKDFVQDKSFHSLRVLEVNQAGSLTTWLSQMPGHKLIEYPDYDMMRLPFDSSSFDLVVHSDTLEHVEYPIRGLSECRRVLKKTGFCVFTVPIIVDRLTRKRNGLPPSYHGIEANFRNDHLVFTEYGCDAWIQVIKAGFNECRIISPDFPASHVLVGVA